MEKSEIIPMKITNIKSLVIVALLVSASVCEAYISTRWDTVGISTPYWGATTGSVGSGQSYYLQFRIEETNYPTPLFGYIYLYKNGSYVAYADANWSISAYIEYADTDNGPQTIVYEGEYPYGSYSDYFYLDVS